ncbi:DUF421 domain-containing protein [Palleronia sp. LCG004]|uniref:DUF421 domain-containing protein n=1 Tax=Palleronia sp. LCG004 TaxID=3079304 RepID=UPI002942D1E6|nr:YetF domain-containing protein [Palleronia sp. LCG004]WOI58266.1 DUF421 domain-containing protein [Palleronia sp. LCG004]
MNDPSIHLWFNDWNRIGSVVVGALVFFAFVVLLTRLLGKRTTAQMNNFDWIIAVAMGSLLSSGILLKDVSIADALVAMAVLGMCQWLTTWLVIRVPKLAWVVKPVPRLLVHDGELVEDALRVERISKDELFARLRAHGYTHLAEVQWVILETDGTMTVIPDMDPEMPLRDAELMQNISVADHLKTIRPDAR